LISFPETVWGKSVALPEKAPSNEIAPTTTDMMAV